MLSVYNIIFYAGDTCIATFEFIKYSEGFGTVCSAEVGLGAVIDTYTGALRIAKEVAPVVVEKMDTRCARRFTAGHAGYGRRY